MKKMRFNALCLHLKGLSEKRENRIERTKYQREMIKKNKKIVNNSNFTTADNIKLH